MSAFLNMVDFYKSGNIIGQLIAFIVNLDELMPFFTGFPMAYWHKLHFTLYFFQFKKYVYSWPARLFTLYMSQNYNYLAAFKSKKSNG